MRSPTCYSTTDFASLRLIQDDKAAFQVQWM